MKDITSDVFAYARGIARKWVLWLFTALDLVALIAQFIYPSFHLPQLVFLLIILIGFFWAGYQVYHDIIVQLPSRPIEPPPYELLPLSFHVELRQEIPQIEIWFYVVNYQSRELVLQSLDVTDFHLSGGPGLANIPMTDETRLPPKRSRLVLCRRALIETEVHAVERTSQSTPTNATFSASTRSLAGRKQLHYRTGSLSANGWVLGIKKPA